jgi:hypothetical protein
MGACVGITGLLRLKPQLAHPVTIIRNDTIIDIIYTALEHIEHRNSARTPSNSKKQILQLSLYDPVNRLDRRQIPRFQRLTLLLSHRLCVRVVYESVGLFRVVEDMARPDVAPTGQEYADGVVIS